MKKDIFQRMTVVEYRTLKPIKDLTYVNGVAVNSEDDLCIACVAWFDRTFGYQKRFDLIHIPNEGKRTRWEGLRIQRMGLRAGSPDYLLSKDGNPVCWLEFKFGKNTLTTEQAEFKRYVEAGGFGFEVIKTFEEFKQALQKYGVYAPKTKDEFRTSFENLFKKGDK